MAHGDLVQIVIRVSIWIAALVIISFIMGKATEKSRSVIVAVTLHAWIDILAEFNQIATYIVFGLAIPFWVYLLWKWENNYRQHDTAKSRAEVML
jgi:membrane protease YdiL (CAAX protease family)